MPLVTISLVIFNGKKYLPFCLDSLASQSMQDFEIMVIDNASIDGSADFVEREYVPKFGSRMRLVRNRENIGFARAQNQAILWSTAPYIVCLNQDIVVDSQFLERAREVLDRHPEAGAVSPKVLRWDFDEHGLTDASKTHQIDTVGLLVKKSLRVSDLGAGEQDTGAYDSRGSVFGVSGALPVYRRAALEDIRVGDDYFDSDFHTYKEDVDLAFRLRWRGWDTVTAPGASAWHARTASTWQKKFSVSTFAQRFSKSPFVNYHSYKNHLFVLIKNIPAGILFRYAPQILWFEFQKFCYALFMEWKTLSALGEVVRKLPAMLRKRRMILGSRKISDAQMRLWLS